MGLGGPYDPSGSGNGSHNQFGGNASAYASNVAYMMHRSAESNDNNFVPQSQDTSSAVADVDMTTGMEDFKEVSLRLILEPFVSSPNEMDCIIKWLKTLNYVLVNRTLSPADLEHSLFARSISLPALVAIYRSCCVADHSRLQQVHGTIETYLRQLGITFPAPDFPASESTKQIASNDVPSSSNVAIKSDPHSQNTRENADGKNNTTTSAIPDSLPSMLPSLPRASSSSSNGSRRTELDQTETKDSVVAGKTQMLLSSTEPLHLSGPDRVTTTSDSGQSNHSNLSAHLHNRLAQGKTESNSYAVPLSLKGGLAEAEDAKKTEKPPPLSTAFSSKYKLLPYAPEPGSGALYQAEQQALAFAEQQARAHAAAQAQAQALAESYHYPRPKEPPSKIAEFAGHHSSGHLALGARGGVPTESISAPSENADDADESDKLMKFHNELVQNLALQKKAAAAAKSKNLRAPVPTGGPSPIAGSVQSQKKRKLEQYTDFYRRAAFPPNFMPSTAYPPSAGPRPTTVGGFDPSFAEHQMHTLANVANGEEGSHGNQFPGYSQAQQHSAVRSNYPSSNADFNSQQSMYHARMGGAPLPLPLQGAEVGGPYSGMLNRAASGGEPNAPAVTGPAYDDRARMAAAMSHAYENSNQQQQQQQQRHLPSMPFQPVAQGQVPSAQQFPPEILALYIQQMYGNWPYGASNGAHMPASGAQQQMQQAQMLHFAESLHNAAMASAGGSRPAMPPANSNNNNSNSNNNSNISSLNASSTAQTASARAYAEMQQAQQLQAPSAVPNKYDEYLKSMRGPAPGGYGYPMYHTAGNGDAGHAMMMAAMNADPRFHGGAYTGDAYGRDAQAAYMSSAAMPGYMMPTSQGTGHDGRLMHLMQASNASSRNPAGHSSNGHSSGGNSNGNGNNGGHQADELSEGDRSDRDGKELGSQSAAAEALLTLLKK